MYLVYHNLNMKSNVFTQVGFRHAYFIININEGKSVS